MFDTEQNSYKTHLKNTLYSMEQICRDQSAKKEIANNPHSLTEHHRNTISFI